jgi:hypothetical protein
MNRPGASSGSKTKKKYPETRSSSSSGPLEIEHIDKRRKTDTVRKFIRRRWIKGMFNIRILNNSRS